MPENTEDTLEIGRHLPNPDYPPESGYLKQVGNITVKEFHAKVGEDCQDACGQQRRGVSALQSKSRGQAECLTGSLMS